MKNNVIVKENATLREKYYFIRHCSGLKIYVFPKQMSTCYALLATKYGAIDNCFRIDQNGDYTTVPDGIAHFLEHKLFEAEDGEETDARFAAIGASSNAFTSSDITAYEVSCTDRFYEALEILLDFVTHPYFTEENVAKEQGIIGQEIDMCDDMPSRRLYYEILHALYENNNTRINVCGTHASIAGITPQHLYTCYHTFYRPSNMTLVVCGDVDHKQVQALADAYFKEQPSVDIDRYFAAEPPCIAKKRTSITMQVARPMFAIGVKDTSPAVGTREAVRRGMIFCIVADWIFGTSSLFYEEAYRTGLINARFSAGYENYRTCGFFLFTGETDEPEKVYQRILQEAKSACRTPPSHEDFSRVKKTIYAEYIRDFDSTEEIANNLLTFSTLDVDILDVGDIIKSITYEEAVAAMQELFREEQFAMSTVLPATETNQG